ncbi:MAG: hypothetical protein WCV43_04800, partial [Candidatus Caldatribacteriota bacterium]
MYSDAGTRIPTTTFHSHLTKSMLSDENGRLALYRDVDNFIDNVLTTSKELIEVNDIKELKNYISEINRDAVNVKFRIEEDKGKYSIAVDYKHPMLDQANAPFSPLSVQLISSFKDKSTLEKIESADIARIALHNFYNELERTSNSSRNDFRVSLLLFKLGDRSKVYDVNVKMKSNYFSIRKQKNEDDKTEVGVEFDKKAIVDVFKDYLRYYEHLSIESAKRWNRVLNRFGKNIDINTKKGIFDYKGFINTLSKKFSSDMHTAILEELQKDVDYSIDKKGNVVVGKALSFDNSIWSGDVLNKLEKLDNEAGWDYLTNNILKPHFINHTKALSQSGYRLENKFKNTISYKGSGYYTQSGDSYSYNDIVYAHFLSHILYDNMFDSLIMGDHTSFSTTLEQAKRYRVVSTGYQIPSVGNRTSSAGQLRSKMSYLVFNDNQETVTLSNGQKKKVLTTDGMSYGSLVGNLYLNRSLGGSYDSSGRGLIKPLITSTDRIKNKTVLLKFAEETVSNQSYRNFRKYRDMERVVLDSWSNKANEALKREGIDFKVDLYSEFEKSYKQNKDGYMAANAVVDYLTNDVDSYISSIVEENIVMGIANESTVKSGLSNLTYGTVKNIGKLKGQNLSALEFNSEDFGIVTKLSHSMEDIRYGAASLNQAEANLSSLDVEGTSFSNSMENLKMRMMELGKQKVMNRFNSSNLGRDVGVRQQLSFLRSLAIDGIKGIKGDSNFAEFVLNPHLDLRSVHIANKVREIYLSYINREVLKPRLNGFMGNIISGDAIELYEKDGLLFTLNKIEAMEGVEFNDSMIKGDKLVVGDSEYNIKGLEYMQWNEDGEMVPGTIVMANPVMDKFKMTPDEDVSDVYTIKLGDKYVNLKAYSLEERADLIVKIAKAHFEGKIDSMAIINVLEGNEYDTDVIFRNLSNSFEQLDNYYNGEGVVKKSDKGSEVMYDMLRNDIINYFNEFEDLTTVVMDRKPHGHPGQMSIHRIVSFVNDNENNVWVDMRGAVRDDTDNDGDQNTLILKAYKREGDLKEDLDWIELNNEYVDIFKNAYSHKSNREKIDQSSDVSDMIKMANEYGNVNTDEFGTFSSALHNYNIGKAGMDAVGIAATAVSSFGVMRSIGIVDEKFLTRNSFLLPKNIQQTIYDQTIDRNLGNQLQFILENMKSQGLGLLNIPSIAVPLISSYLINYNGDKTSTSDINKEMVEFMRNSYVQKVFKEESEKNRISEYNVYPNIARNVKSKIGSLKSEMNNITDEMLDDAQKTVDESIKKVTNIYSDLRSILSKHDMNDLWTIIRGSVIGKITFDDGQIDELKDKSDDYVRDLIVSKLEEGDLLSKDLEKRFRELVEKYRGDLPKIIDTINSKLAEMRLLQLDIKKENQLLKKAEANKILPKLYDLAVRAESMRRFSGFIAIRNGVETKKNEFDKKKRQLENSIGGDLNSLINGEYNSETKAQRLSRHLDHFRKNNNELWRSKDAADVRLLLDVETDIVQAMNIEALLGHPKMKRYLEMSKVYAAPYNYIGENEGIFLDEYSGFKEVQDDIKAKLNLGTLSDEQMFLMSQTINDVFIAKYMEKEKTTIDKLFPEGLNISTIENFYNESGKFVIGDTEHASLKNIDLSTRKGRYMFEKAFPSFIMSLRDINRSVKNMSEDSIEVYDENNREALMSWVNSMDNGFLQMYDLAGRSGKEYLAFDSSMSMSADTKRYLSEEFLKLPQDLQKLFFYYETIRNKFHYRKGSAYDAMPIDMYRDMSKYTEDIINSIKEDLLGVNRDSFIDVFTDVYTSQQKGLKYMPKNADLVELIDTDLVEMKAGKNKVFPGNNSNTSGVPMRGYQWRENDNYKKKVTVELTVNDGSIRSNLIHNIFGYGGFPMEYVNPNSNLNTRSVVVYSPVIRVLSHDDMFSFKDAIRNGNNYSTTLHYTHPVNYGEGTYYTELGDMISMSKMDGKGDESGYVWNAYLNETGEVDDIKVLKSELVVSKAVNTNRDMVDRLGDQAANAVELEFDSEASISKIKRWLNNNTKFGDVKPVLAYLTNSCNMNNTATLSILMQGNLNRNSIKHGDMAQLRVSYGEENVGKIISQSDDISVYGLPVAASKLVEKRGFLSHSQEDVEQYTEEDLRNNIRDFFDTVKENPEVPFVLAKHSSRDNIATIVKDDVVMVMKEAKTFNELMAEEYAMYLQNNGRLDNLFFTLDMSHNINKALLGNTSGYEAAINDLMSTESALDEKRFQAALNYVGEDIANQIRSRLGRVPELGLKPNGTVDKNLRTLMDVYGKDGIKVWYNLFLLGDTYQWREVKVDEDKNTYVEVGEGLQYLGDVSNVDNITQDDKSYYRGQYDKPIIDSNGNLILKAREDDLYKKAGLKSFGVSMTRDLESAKEYGIGQNEVRYNLKSDELGYDVNTWEGENELSEITDNGYYLIQVSDDISNEIVKEAGEIKAINDVIVPKGKYKIQHITESDTSFTESKLLGEGYTSPIKQGVSELFESNPELANEVYEALGFGQENNIEAKKDDIERRRREELKRFEGRRA